MQPKWSWAVVASFVAVFVLTDALLHGGFGSDSVLYVAAGIGYVMAESWSLRRKKL
jgi:hypothetical protein